MAAVPARAAEIGAASMLGIQLWVEGDNLAALNLYSRRVDTFDDESEQIGLLFASHAAVAFASVQDMNHMRTALATRDLIGQAKGNPDETVPGDRGPGVPDAGSRSATTTTWPCGRSPRT